MKVAIAYDVTTGEIGEQFGGTSAFAVYDYYGETVAECSKSVVDCSEQKGDAALAALLSGLEIAAVMVQTMSPTAKADLLSSGIVPVTGFCGDADTAADMLVTGTLPTSEGGGCGGCSGCGGSCGCGDEGGDCGCGGGCGCGMPS